jgi:hypothetical protein
MLVLGHLQPERPAGEHQRNDGDDADRDQRALEINALLEGIVLDAHATHASGAGRSARRRP